MIVRTRFEELALPHKDAAHNLAYWIVRNADDAEDVVQEAYLRAFRAFGGFSGEAMRPWLLAIVRNAAYRMLEKRRRTGSVISLEHARGDRGYTEIEEVPSPEPGAEELLIAESEGRQLHRALAELPVAHRDVVVLREMEGLSYAEIAEVVGVPVGTVMSRLSRGREQLRATLLRLRAKEEPDAV